ncbi:hypothetical protein D1631_04085 [Chryseobacterium nematophagum]|uniref:Uncharacterized protein n=1 Tax=Chryseobacterium nematophagum TaxID=2305228 RepID=A0A3M7TCH5_9FLAO|nr:hypothetical protein [Chryseobacterium nematophagum]RNA61171.1 hypothetical protein D1631_04085 [Chryseobacterium nematophagum]
MEKFQKYCLGVLLVIIYNNVSTNHNVFHESNCYNLVKIYGQFLAEKHAENETNLFKKKVTFHGVFSSKNKAEDTLIKFFLRKKQNINPYKIIHFNTLASDMILENFEKRDVEYSIFGRFYIKNKVSKIRNKDYLDLNKGTVKTDEVDKYFI